MAGYTLGNFDGGSKVDSGASARDFGRRRTGQCFRSGVNYDYNFYPNLAFRVTPTYVGTTFGGTVQNNLGVNAGIVYRFGRLK